MKPITRKITITMRPMEITRDVRELLAQARNYRLEAARTEELRRGRGVWGGMMSED